ncbi:hypothetical protein WJX73_009760 [Symbiochloris irregularis]|uniref:C3H1-type domain-containing protein n=1 Tax=Symbiochloris irregularis TaxID=706552 RepID=A0AAW1PCH6_9CHLO
MSAKRWQQEPRYQPQILPSDTRYKTGMCRYFEAGLCGRGNECSYAHNAEELYYHINLSKFGKAAADQLKAKRLAELERCNSRPSHLKATTNQEMEEVMKEPVIASDAQSYERKAIEDWRDRI